LEALCLKSTTNAHGEWTIVFRRFAEKKLHLPPFCSTFGVTPNADCAISALYAASMSLVQWLSHPEQNYIDLANTWGPGQDLANLDVQTALFLIALQQARQVLLTNFGCDEWSIDGPAPAPTVPQFEGSSPYPAAKALHLATPSYL